MDKIIKNERFRNAIDCLYAQKLIESDVDAANKIGISKSGLSRLLNDRKGVSVETLRKMNDAFGGIFNMAYFRGESDYMLVEDAAAETSAPYPTTSQPDSDILELYARMIRKLDDTRVELQKEIAEVRQLKDELRLTISHLKGTTYSIPDESPRLAAEEIKTKEP
ncbi:MAG: helix-turn-helix domain-containing protein [Bacteroidales bacterium]|nr:helix-turn-helix domain-containing protein [Bacteroidales bacterium]